MESMTGYGEGTASTDHLQITAQSRSVNHRYLDIVVRLPENLRRYERDLVALVRSRVSRGRIELRVDLRAIGEHARRVSIRAEILRSYAESVATLKREGILTGEPTPGDLLRLPEVVEVEPESYGDEEEEKKAVLTAASGALEGMSRARREEGDRLKTVLQELLSALSSQIETLAGLREALSNALHERLQARLDGLLQEPLVDAQRLAMEVAILVERSDVQEELDRLQVHLQAFDDLMSSDEPVGKRLDFLCQEVLRELNTVGSKCRDSAATVHVLEGKVVCDQLREQVQNIQ